MGGAGVKFFVYFWTMLVDTFIFEARHYLLCRLESDGIGRVCRVEFF